MKCIENETLLTVMTFAGGFCLLLLRHVPEAFDVSVRSRVERCCVSHAAGRVTLPGLIMTRSLAIRIEGNLAKLVAKSVMHIRTWGCVAHLNFTFVSAGTVCDLKFV